MQMLTLWRLTCSGGDAASGVDCTASGAAHPPESSLGQALPKAYSVASCVDSPAHSSLTCLGSFAGACFIRALIHCRDTGLLVLSQYICDIGVSASALLPTQHWCATPSV